MIFTGLLTQKKSYFIITVSVICVLSLKCLAQQPDSTKKNQIFEISFGQSLLFISQKKIIKILDNSAVVIPTSAILFFVEFRPQKKIKIPVFFNLPTESQQFLVNGQLVNERAAPTYGAGLEFKIFQIKISSESKLDFELGPLASFIMDKKESIRIVPIIAGRTRVMRGENFVMYIGGSYSFGINTFGILYGTGTIF